MLAKYHTCIKMHNVLENNNFNFEKPWKDHTGGFRTQGRAAVCDCGTRWIFLLPFFHKDIPTDKVFITNRVKMNIQFALCVYMKLTTVCCSGRLYVHIQYNLNDEDYRSYG